jgi:hypothetical protein
MRNIVFIFTIICLSCGSQSETNKTNFDANDFYVRMISLNISIPNSVNKKLGSNYYSATDILLIKVGLRDSSKRFNYDSLRLVFYRNDKYLTTIRSNNIRGEKVYEKSFTTNDNESIYQQYSFDVYIDTNYVTTNKFTSFNYSIFKKENTVSHTKIVSIFKENQAKFDEGLLNQSFFVKGIVEKIVKKGDIYAIYLQDEYIFTGFQYRMDKNVDLTKVNKGDEVLLFGKCTRPNKYSSDFTELDDDIIFRDCDIINY